MKRKQFRIISFMIVMIMGAVVGFSVSIGYPLLAIGAVLAGMAVIYLSKTGWKGLLKTKGYVR